MGGGCSRQREQPAQYLGPEGEEATRKGLNRVHRFGGKSRVILAGKKESVFRRNE